MNRAQAYEILALHLQSLQAAGYHALLQRLHQPPAIQRIQLNDEEITIETIVSWANEKRQVLKATATAFGPGTWLTQRFSESFNIEKEV